MEEGKVCGGGEGPRSPSAEATPLTFDAGEQLAASVEWPELATSTDFLLGPDDKMSFLQMLQTLYSSSNMKINPPKTENQILELEVDSCMPNLHSLAKPEDKCGILEDKGGANSFDECRNDLGLVRTIDLSKPLLSDRKVRKPKRAKIADENMKDVEKQRTSHIAVERNRRRLMSDYLVMLRSLLPHDYALKGGQASIVEGVIDYVKKLEHRLKYLETQKRQRKMYEIRSPDHDASKGSLTSASVSSSSDIVEINCGKKAELNIMVVQTHANLCIKCEDMTLSKLISFLAAIEELGLTILHLNINSMHHSSFYSLSLKVEDDSKIRSAEQISGSVEKVLNSLNICNGTRSSTRNQNHDEARNVKDEQ